MSNILIKEYPLNNLVVIPGKVFTDKNISLQAKGLYAFLYTVICNLSESNYILESQDLFSLTNDHPNIIESALQELQEAGYITITSEGDIEL